MATLYELTEQAVTLIEMLESGDIDEQILTDTLEAMCVKEKLEDCCKVIRQLEADAEVYKKEKDFFAKKQQSAKNGVDRIKRMITQHLLATNTDKLDAGIFKIKHTKSKAVEVIDEEQISILYKIERPCKFDKRAIAQAIKDGEDVGGAVLVTRDGCSIK